MAKQIKVADDSKVTFTVSGAGDRSGAKGLDDLLPLVITETLESIFKAVGVNTIYEYMEKKFQLEREKIVRKPEAFSTGLKELLGSGASVIEDLILKNLYRKLDLTFTKKEGCDFLEHIMELRR